MTVAAAIVTWNDEPVIGRCLASLHDAVTATSMEDWNRFVAKWGRPPR